MANLPPNKPPPWTRLSGIGVEYAGAVVGFSLVGVWVDSHWQTKPWGVLIGVALGLVGATYNLIRTSLAEFEPLRKPGKLKKPGNQSGEVEKDAGPVRDRDAGSDEDDGVT